MEWGSWHGVTTSWESHTFNQIYNDPIIVAVAEYNYTNNNLNSINAEIQSVTSTGCQTRMGVPPHDALPSQSSPSSCIIHYMVCENTDTEPNYFLPGTTVRVQAGKFNDTDIDYATSNWSTDGNVTIYPNFTNDLVVFSQRTTHNNAQWADTWCCKTGDRGEAPDPDDQTMHIHFQRAKVSGSDFNTSETLHYIILETGFGTLSGSGIIPKSTAFKIAKSGDIVEGIENSVDGYIISTVSPLSKPGTAITTQLTMGGGDGSWSVIKSRDENYIRAWELEDQDSGDDRAHTTEEHGVIMFEKD